MTDSTVVISRAEYCVIACAEAWRGDGEVLASPMGLIPSLGARLARRTFAPDLLLTDGEATLVGADGAAEGWLPYRRHLTMVTGGRRHVMMGASQIDRFGNQNISCIGDWAAPTRQLLGVRGAPVNTLNNPVSYWIPRHSPGCSYPRSTWCAASATTGRPPPGRVTTASPGSSATSASSTSPHPAARCGWRRCTPG